MMDVCEERSADHAGIQQRLAMEKKLVAKYLPRFQFLRRGDEIHVEGWVSTSAGGKYKLRVVLASDSPWGRRRVYVLCPRNLPTWDGDGVLGDWAVSHCAHTLGKGADGSLEIDVVGRPDASDTCVNYLVRAIVWCESYEWYLRTGSWPERQ